MTDEKPRCGAQWFQNNGGKSVDDAVCELPPGTNAYNEERDENVHVHRFTDPTTGAVWRWEDPPEGVVVHRTKVGGGS